MTNDPCRVLSDCKILVVEDERLIALDMKDMLEGWGATVIGPVGTSSAALELVAEFSLDVAVLDVHLGTGTSEPVAAALREHDCPFIVLSAYERRHLDGALRDAPLLSKPVNESKLRQTLSGVLLKERSR